MLHTVEPFTHSVFSSSSFLQRPLQCIHSLAVEEELRIWASDCPPKKRKRKKWGYWSLMNLESRNMFCSSFGNNAKVFWNGLEKLKEYSHLKRMPNKNHMFLGHAKKGKFVVIGWIPISKKWFGHWLLLCYKSRYKSTPNPPKIFSQQNTRATPKKC